MEEKEKQSSTFVQNSIKEKNHKKQIKFFYFVITIIFVILITIIINLQYKNKKLNKELAENEKYNIYYNIIYNNDEKIPQEKRKRLFLYKEDEIANTTKNKIF